MSGVKRHLKASRLPAFGAVLSILILTLLLAACGYNGTSTGSQPPTSATATPTAPVQVQKCGTLHTMRLLLVPTDQSFAKQDEQCFAQAYQQCHPATLVYSQSSLDTGTIHNFSVKNLNGKCTIQDVVQTYIAPKPAHTTGTYTCSGLAMQSDGLHINSCGAAGDVFMPLATMQ